MGKTYNQQALLAQLKQEVTGITATVTAVKSYTEKQLTTQPAPGKWSVAQVIEHLNTYNTYYLLHIAKVMQAARITHPATFRAGWLGEYFTKSMYSEVVTAKKVTNKMSAMKGHIPGMALNAGTVIDEFLRRQQELLRLIDGMQALDMSSVRVPITITRFIKISMGDALRFLVAHQVRHELQIKNVVATLQPVQAQRVVQV